MKSKLNVYLTLKIMGPTYWCNDLDLSGSRDVSCHVNFWFPRCHFLYVQLHCRVSISPAIFGIMGPKHIGVTTFVFLCHVTSSVTWPIDPPHVISYWCPIVTKLLSLIVFEIFSPQYQCAHTPRHTRRKWFYILSHSHAMYCIGQTIKLQINYISWG